MKFHQYMISSKTKNAKMKTSVMDQMDLFHANNLPPEWKKYHCYLHNTTMHSLTFQNKPKHIIHHHNYLQFRHHFQYHVSFNCHHLHINHIYHTFCKQWIKNHALTCLIASESEPTNLYEFPNKIFWYKLIPI